MPYEKTEERWVATVHIVLSGDCETQAEAADEMSAIFTENLEANGVIRDWGYVQIGKQWMYPSKQHVPVEIFGLEDVGE